MKKWRNSHTKDRRLTLEFSLSGGSFTLARVLIREAALLDLECGLETQDDAMIFKASGPQEVLSSFADKLTQEMPTSIKSGGFNVCQSAKSTTRACFLPPKPPVSPCPKCQRAVLDERSADFYNPYRACFVCGHGVQKSAQNSERLFADLALAIASGQAVRLKTINDDLVLSKAAPPHGNFRIICRDLATLGSLAVISNDEILSLASIEKPRAVLALKPLFRSTESVDRYFAECSLPFCMVEFLLLEKLSALGISKVFARVPRGESFSADFSTASASTQERLMFLETKRAFSLRRYTDDEPAPSGDGIFLIFNRHAPNFLAYRVRSVINAEFIAFNFNFRGFAGLFEMIKNRDENSAKLIENYKKTFGALYGSLSRAPCEPPLALNFYGLLGVLGLVLGFEGDPSAALDLGNGKDPNAALDLASVKDLTSIKDPSTAQDPDAKDLMLAKDPTPALDPSSSIDPNGKDLTSIQDPSTTLDLAKAKDPNAVQDLTQDLSKAQEPHTAKNLTPALDLASAKDLSSSTDPSAAYDPAQDPRRLSLERIHQSAEIFLNAADDFLGKKGPAIDFKLVKFEGKFFLDVVPVIKSAMSFKLAGVDRHVLAYGVIDSFSAFLSNNADDLNTKNVHFLGAIFNHRSVLFKTASKFDKNYKIL
ncbi:MAG: hypothetical protein ACTTIC_00170 [Helicobacteraceae bacterium]